MTHYIGSVPETKRKTDWRLQGSCSDHPTPDIWHATGNTRNSRYDLEEAKDICLGCPVMLICREWALTNREEHGLWGGLTEAERRRILRRRVASGSLEPRKGGRPRAACGTASAYDRHVKRNEPIDDACRTAHARASAERRAKTKPLAA